MCVRTLFFWAFLSPFVLFGSTRAQSQEVILSYRSEIDVLTDASLQVKETIQVRADGMQIRHGIYRDFPTTYQDRYGLRYRVRFDVLAVTRDGQAEPYKTEGVPAGSSGSGGVRVKIGRPDKVLSPGNYTYSILYRTDRQLGFFADHDELYWNVTGNGWNFPILSADAHVKLPQGAAWNSVQLEAYTGPEGAQGKNYRAGIASKGDEAVFSTLNPLMPKEGLTIVVSFPKGLVHEPTTSEKLIFFFRDNITLFRGLGGLAAILLYYIYYWNAVGIDPNKGTIVPLYAPPADFLPADVRFLSRMKFDEKVLTAAIINMGVKGYLTITETSGVYTLTRTGQGEQELSQHEKNIGATLFASGDRLKVDSEMHSKFNAANRALRAALEAAHVGTNFSRNSEYAVRGAIFSVLIILGVALLSAQPVKAFMTIFLCVWLSFWTVALGALLFFVFKAWKAVLSGAVHGPGLILPATGAVFISLLSLPFIAFEFFVLRSLYSSGGAALAAIIALAIAINVIFAKLLKAPTASGRKLMDQIEGFKMYLSTAEGDRLQTLYPPTKTPALFEKFLPYALALGVEQAWAEKFAGVIACAEASPEHSTGYSPTWYSGSNFDNLGTFSSSFSSSFSSALSASARPPGSSSGGGGGGSSGGSGGSGSSGGGGGGGGGGGW